MVSERFSVMFEDTIFFCITLITWRVHLIFSASQNGKLPPIPRNSENNGSVSKFSFHVAPNSNTKFLFIGSLTNALMTLVNMTNIFNYCECQYLAKHLSALLWWHNPHIVKHVFKSLFFRTFYRLRQQLQRENNFYWPKFQNFSLG